MFRKKILLLGSLLLVLVAIPLTVYLTRQQQEIRKRASQKSKLSAQTAWQKAGVMEFIETAQPVVVKLLDGFNRAGEIKQKSGGTFIVGRIYEANQPQDGSPETRAQEWFNRNSGTLNNPNIDCWEGYNEPDVSNDNAVRWISSFEIKRMQLLEGIGKKACIGNFSVGNPDYPRWQYFREAINYATPRGHYLALHEYGPTSMSDQAEHYSLRHRKVYQENGFTLPLIITETGIDENGNPNTGGWRAHTNAGDYFNQLRWYDDRLKEDSYVRGATIFSYGLYDWDSFEIYPELTGGDGRTGPLTAYIRGGSVPTPTFGPSPTPVPCTVSWSLSNSNPPPNTNIEVRIRGVNDPGGWQNIGLKLDGGTSGVTGRGIENPWPTFVYSVNSGGGGSHTLVFTVDRDYRTCTPNSTFTTTGTTTPTTTPTPSPSPTRSPTPSLTLTPSPTLPPGATGLTLAFTLQGIQPTANLQDPSREVQVEIFDVGKRLIKQETTRAVFERGVFRGTLNLGNNFPSGNYAVKLRVPKTTLKKQVEEVSSIRTGGNNSLPEVGLFSGDLNNDNELNAIDYANLISCLGQSTPNCLVADFNGDGTVDTYDLSILIFNFSHREGD